VKCFDAQNNDIVKDVKHKELKMTEWHLVIGSIIACIVLVASAVDLYELTHSE
jgi:hypothetical protein